MLRYEVLMLAVPEITQDEVNQLEKRLEKVIEQQKGTVVSFERWGKYRLAYPVKKNEYGIYFLMRFEVAAEPALLFEELKTIFAVKLNDIVMRYVISRLDSHASLAYQRPPSLEDAPSRDVDTFLREHKMDGILALDAKKEFAQRDNDDEHDMAVEDFETEAEA